MVKRRSSRLRRLCIWLARRAHDRGDGRVIRHYGAAYLARFRLYRNRWFGVYLHRFIRHDVDPEHHSHPWPLAIAIGLVGRYLEHYLGHGLGLARVRSRVQAPGSVRVLRRKSYHRVERLLNREVWTLFIVFGRNNDQWFFQDPATGEVTHWEPFVKRHDRRGVD